MKVWVTVKANAKHEKIEQLDQRNLRVSVKEPPREGKANKAVIRLLSQYFSVPQNSVQIISGVTAKRKLIEILDKR